MLNMFYRKTPDLSDGFYSLMDIMISSSDSLDPSRYEVVRLERKMNIFLWNNKDGKKWYF